MMYTKILVVMLKNGFDMSNYDDRRKKRPLSLGKKTKE